MNLTMQICTGLACVIVMVRTEPAFNNMHGGTDFWVRLVFWLMAVVCGIEILAMAFYSHVPDWREALLAGTLAALLLCERRLRYLTRLGSKRGNDATH